MESGGVSKVKNQQSFFLIICFLRLHLAIQAYKELLINLTFMDKSEDGSLQENTKIIKGWKSLLFQWLSPQKCKRNLICFN